MAADVLERCHRNGRTDIMLKMENRSVVTVLMWCDGSLRVQGGIERLKPLLLVAWMLFTNGIEVN